MYGCCGSGIQKGHNANSLAFASDWGWVGWGWMRHIQGDSFPPRSKHLARMAEAWGPAGTTDQDASLKLSNMVAPESLDALHRGSHL